MTTSRGRLGARGEKTAREYLEAKGYRIETTDFRCPWGEVDIIAWDRDRLVFVEVRTRRAPENYGSPRESLSRRKMERLVATAETYLQGLPTPPEEWRIDLVGIRIDGLGGMEPPEHIENAVQLG